MHGTYLQNKNSIYNYREKNPEKIKAILKKAYIKRSTWKNIQKEFFNILIIEFVKH
jgi:hypothetical protein